MIQYIGGIVVLLWIAAGSVLGQRYYRQLRDEQGYSPWPAMLRAVILGFSRPPWLLVKGAWGILSLGFIRKKK